MLTKQQKEHVQNFRAFVQQEIVPVADQNDQEEQTPRELITKVAQQGYLGALIPTSYGGQGWDMVTCGLLYEEVGRGCSSLRSLLTVHSMVASALLRWGNQQQKDCWLPALASGEVIGAFALTEPHAGSNIAGIQTRAEPKGEAYVLNGTKKWITYGRIANLFLVFAQTEQGPGAFLLEQSAPGLSIKALSNVLGTRASMLAELHFNECRTSSKASCLVGKCGFGLTAVAALCLDIGRYSVAWGCVGIIQACLDASLAYAKTRQQFGSYLKEHQLIQQMLTEMITNAKAARLLCYQAGVLKEAGDPNSMQETWIAKYFASTHAFKAASDAVQIHGANGCSSAYPVQRYLRDAKVMEIIEGSTQIQQMKIAEYRYFTESI